MTTVAPLRQRILGIDPGLRITGFGVIDRVGGQLVYVASGCIKTSQAKSGAAENLPERLKVILDGIAEIVGAYRPYQSAIEKVFVNVNPQSTLLLGQARGAAIAALTSASQPVFEYTALQVKQAVVGNGHADKQQVMHMVKRLLNLPAEPRSDSADALACAICHAHGGMGLGGLVTATRRRRAGRML